MPYGTFVASGALAGFIGLVVMAGSESPRAAPFAVSDAHVPEALPLASSASQRPNVSLERSANLLFADLPSGSAHVTSSERANRVELPIGERVIVYYGTLDMFRIGTLEAADGEWVQLWLRDAGKRIWIALKDVTTIEAAPSGADLNR